MKLKKKKKWKIGNYKQSCNFLEKFWFQENVKNVKKKILIKLGTMMKSGKL